jgi:hypothetical protein
MRRRLRWAFNSAALVSAVLFLATCVLWVLARTGYDEVTWSYDRYLADRSAASNQVILTSDRRLWLNVVWGRVGPYNGQLVWGYYLNADQSGGHPRLAFQHGLLIPLTPLDLDLASSRYDNVDSGTSGWGPLRWYTESRSRPKDGDDFRAIRIGVSHWLAAMVLLVPPMLWLSRFRQARRTRRRGLCPSCGYDLRATPGRCPECGRHSDHPCAFISPAAHAASSASNGGSGGLR